MSCRLESQSTAAGPASASVLNTNGLTGAVEWDVTADALQALDLAPTLTFGF